MSTGSPRAPRVWLGGFSIAALWAGVVTGAVIIRSGSVSALAHLAPPNAERTLTDRGVTVFATRSRGYDGQFFYRMAVAPFSTSARVHGVRFDDPALRWSRILYPTIAHVLALGNSAHVPIALVAMNIVAAGAAGGAGVMIARRAGREWWLGLSFVLVPGVTYGLTGDLADVLALALVLSAIWLIVQDHITVPVVLLALAALTRESTLVVPLAIGLGYLGRYGRRRAWGDLRRSVALGGVPFVVAAGWQLVIHDQWGSFGLAQSGGHDLTYPLGLYLHHPSLLNPSSGFAAVRLLIIAMAVVGAIAAAASLTRSGHGDSEPADRPPFLVPGVALTALLLVCMGSNLVFNFRNLGRATTELFLFATLACLWTTRRHLMFAGLAIMSAGGLVLALWEIKTAVGP